MPLGAPVATLEYGAFSEYGVIEERWDRAAPPKHNTHTHTLSHFLSLSLTLP